MVGFMTKKSHIFKNGFDFLMNDCIYVANLLEDDTDKVGQMDSGI